MRINVARIWRTQGRMGRRNLKREMRTKSGRAPWVMVRRLDYFISARGSFWKFLSGEWYNLILKRSLWLLSGIEWRRTDMEAGRLL